MVPFVLLITVFNCHVMKLKFSRAYNPAIRVTTSVFPHYFRRVLFISAQQWIPGQYPRVLVINALSVTLPFPHALPLASPLLQGGWGHGNHSPIFIGRFSEKPGGHQRVYSRRDQINHPAVFHCPTPSYTLTPPPPPTGDISYTLPDNVG